MRRAAISRFFSRQQMLRLEPEVHALAQQLCDKLLSWAGRGPIPMIHAFNCFTSDTISQYAYGEKLGRFPFEYTLVRRTNGSG